MSATNYAFTHHQNFYHKLVNVVLGTEDSAVHEMFIFLKAEAEK